MERLKRIKLHILLAMLAVLCALLGTLFLGVNGLQMLKVKAETAVTLTQNGPRLASSKGGNYEWFKSSGQSEDFALISGVTSQYYDLSSQDVGAYFKVRVDGVECEKVIGPIGNYYEFDLAQGAVTMGPSFSGKNALGETVSGSHAQGNIYVVKQSNNTVATKNGISFSNASSSIVYDITLDGVNIYETFTSIGAGVGPQVQNYSSTIHIPAGYTMKVNLRVKGENSVRGIHYYTQTNTSSYLKITDINGDGETSGYLYVPKKVAAEDIDAFVKSTLNHNHWNAGIGGDDGNADVNNLTIAGGNVQVLTTASDNCTAIGAGGNGVATVNITGGNVYAACNGTGTALGGGIGWQSYGGGATVNISGGTVYAKNYGNITTTSGGKTYTVGGVAIGGGSSFHSSGAKGTVNITGGNVEAYGTFGNGIGGGNSSTQTGGSSTVNISGGTVIASSIGGGNSQSGGAGKATVVINDTANVTLQNGIGGGDSFSGRGGDAEITVNNGVLHCATTIGGGNGGGNGNGGDAIITVNGGQLISRAIGGGLGAGSGNGGGANVTVTGGKMLATTIGGGNGGSSGRLGNATANISGGEITGQFIMAQGANPCTFTMSGGTLYGVDTSLEEYTHKNGGAVYIEDTNGEVRMRGGVIKGGVAENGGAIYLGGGNVYISGGSIENNKAKQNGGAIYLNGGNVYISGGSIENNEAKENGGGVYVGNGNFFMEGGAVLNNLAQEGMGGGAYVQGTDHIQISVRSGSIEGNKAKEKGGAIAVVGDASTQDLVITIGVKAQHYDEDKNPVACNHKEHGDIDQWDCPIVRNNQTFGEESEGGAFYVTGSYQTYFNMYCLVESDNFADGGQSKSDFMKVDGGSVLISSLENDSDPNADEAIYGNVLVQGSFHVAAGQVQLKGGMSAPKLMGAITVDIKLGGDDFFYDEREPDGVFYKIQYFEDFQSSGRYTVYQVAEGETHTISGAMYGNSGYAFDGWWTKEQGNYAVGYGVGDRVVVTQNLELYAKWNANVYFVIFNANVPPETTYQGKTEKGQYAYNTAYNLTKNGFKYVGYAFQGWAYDPNATQVDFVDEERVFNLSETAGVEIHLYAIWKKCEHGTLIYFVQENVMTRYCDCEAVYETATLKGETCTYDTFSHAAVIAYSGAPWEDLDLSIEHIYKAYGESEFAPTSQVVNAGYYEASFTCFDLTAKLSFEIKKATQAPPKKPTYQAEEEGWWFNKQNKIVIEGNEDKEDWQVYEYRIAYLSQGGDIVYVYNEDLKNNVYYLEIALKNYFIYARFAETQNYLPSDYTQADAVYFFAGNVTLTVICQEGIEALAQEASEGNSITGITINCTILEGFYRLSTFGIDTAASQLNGSQHQVNGLTISIDQIPRNSDLVVYITGVNRGVVISSSVTSSEVFGTVEGESANIANDSAFTAYFEVSYYESYSSLCLEFGKSLPVGTTLLMIDKTATSYTYWYYRVGEARKEIAVESFKSMLDGQVYELRVSSFKYQFIIDFSACEREKLLTGNLTVELKATPVGEAPAFPSSTRTTKLSSVQFDMQNQAIAGEPTLSNELVITYANTDENAAISKWENRQAALVLTAVSPIPLDASFEAVEDGRTTVYYQTGTGKFILPLCAQENSLANLELTLKSELFPVSGGAYAFKGELFVSNSAVGKAPMNTVPLKQVEMQFKVQSQAEIAIKISGSVRRCPLNGSFTVFVEGILPSGYQLSADVLYKNKNGVYNSTGLWPKVEVGGDLTVSLENMMMLEEGSYCLMLTVKETSTAVVKMRVPYYFIVYG